jgi:hypothetical protein
MMSHTGYRRDSPHKDRPMNLIPSSRISMKGVDHPVIGSDGVTTRMMLPGEEHEFANPLVTEIPVKGLFALMTKDMMANGTLPSGGKPKALLDDGTPVKQQRPATSQEKLDAFLVAHPEARGTKWEAEGRRLVKEGESKSKVSPVKGTPLVFKNGGEMNKNEFLTTIARIAAKKAKIPMTMFPPETEDKGEDVLAYLQQGGQVPQEIIDMYLAQQGKDHFGVAASGFTNTLDDLFGSAYQTQRDKIHIEDFNPEVQTAQDGAEVPAYIRRNRYRGYVPDQNAIDLRYQGVDHGLTHPGVIAPVNWGQSTLGSYDVKYRNPIWGKNVKRREYYEFYTPYGTGSTSGPATPYQSPAVARTPRPVPQMSGNVDQSPYRVQSHVDVPYMDAGMLDGSSTWQDPDGVSNFDPATGRIIQSSQSPAQRMKMGKLLLKKGYLTPGLQKSLRDEEVAKNKATVSKYDYLLHPEQQRTRVDEELLQKQRENEYRMLKSQFKRGGSIEDRLRTASEFYRKGGMKC